ncbi:MAG: hypothetical protein K9M51_00710 [Candidatus Gracilibacteria bacterium]|nr:hypothetical protein [Candidatus Gracilibacteria bacterium]
MNPLSSELVTNPALPEETPSLEQARFFLRDPREEIREKFTNVDISLVRGNGMV